MKSKNDARSTHFIIGAELFAYNGFITFFAPLPMGGHPHVGGPHRIWPPLLLWRVPPLAYPKIWAPLNRPIQMSPSTLMADPVGFYRGFPFPLQPQDSIPGPLDPEPSPLSIAPPRLQGLGRQSLGWFFPYFVSLFSPMFYPKSLAFHTVPILAIILSS